MKRSFSTIWTVILPVGSNLQLHTGMLPVAKGLTFIATVTQFVHVSYVTVVERVNDGSEPKTDE